MNKITNCKICGKKLKGKQTMYCTVFCKNKAHQSYNAQKSRGLERKVKIVELLGGKFSEIDDELRKCILVCHNCHAEIHNPQHDLASISLSRLL